MPKSKFPVCANFIFVTKQYQRRLWTKLAWIVIFTTIMFDVCKSRHRIVRVRKGSNKIIFAFKLFQLCDSKTQQRHILQEVVHISKGYLSLLVDSLRGFLNFFDEASKFLKFPLPKLKIEIGSTKLKTNLFAHYSNDFIEHPYSHNRFSFRFGNNKSCVFSIKKFKLHGNQFINTEIVNLNHFENPLLFENHFYVANKFEISESNYDV